MSNVHVTETKKQLLHF